MKLFSDKTKQNPQDIIKSIMKREGKSATKLAGEMGVSDQALRKRLRGGSKFSVEEFTGILEHVGYKIMIVKKEDIV